MSESKRVRITNDRLNNYGTRVLTAGMDVAQYSRNPVLLYMHRRGEVIGYVKDLKVENGEVTGELMFDCASDISVRCKKQWEFGSLKMVSAGLDILETSDDESLLAEGQTSPTITRSKLFEVSLVDIGANDDAIVLMRNGQQITLGRDSACPLPLLINKPIQTEKQMEQKQIALQLGLPATAAEADITARIDELKAAAGKCEKLAEEKETLRLAAITATVEKAMEEKRITADKKDYFITLGKDIGQKRLSDIFAAMQPHVKLSAMVGSHSGAPAPAKATYAKLGEVPSDVLLEMREKDPGQYRRLYRAEYGIDCEL